MILTHLVMFEFFTGAGAASIVVPEPEITRQKTYGGGDHDYAARVRHWWDEIERIQRERREKDRAAEEAQRQLAELEAKKRQTKTLAKRREKLEERIDEYRAETEAMAAQIADLQAQIALAEAAIEAQLAFNAARRRAALFMMMAATQ